MAFVVNGEKIEEATIKQEVERLRPDYERVFAVIGQELAASHRQFGMQVLVCKFIPGELDLDG